MTVARKQPPDLLWGIGRCLGFLGALPERLVWDREGALHAGGGRPTAEFAGFCGALAVGWLFCEPRDPQAKGIVERHQGHLETNFEPGRSFAGPDHYSTSSTLILSEKPDATFVAGFTTWRDKLGYRVRKGETGIAILCPAPLRVVDADPDTGEEQTAIRMNRLRAPHSPGL